MNILVTGASGFLGKNLIYQLHNLGYKNIFEYDKDINIEFLDQYCEKCDFVFNLAGVNRPEKTDEFAKGNTDFTSYLLSKLKDKKNTCPVVFSSSIQANLDNEYGKSKRDAEEILIKYSKETGAKIYIYRFPNIFGKWCRPNYNSVVATFCYNIARNLDIKINDTNKDLKLVYIDDVVRDIISKIEDQEKRKDKFYYEIQEVYNVKLGKLAELIMSFKDSRNNITGPNGKDAFESKLYATYLSYLDENNFSYCLDKHEDQRGSFTEFLKTSDNQQVSINIAKPGVVRGNHWHNTKNEKFLIIKGQGIIRFRKVFESEIFEYRVSGDEFRVLDIPPGYVHNIENIGEEDLITIMWASELFDKNNPDTYYAEV